MSIKRYFVYIVTNFSNRVFYTGVTNDLIRRIAEHKGKLSKFTTKYNVSKLIYYEEYADIRDAIAREKQIKGGSRKKKFELITSMNPNFEDLYNKII
jgi:putative endonuclease